MNVGFTKTLTDWYGVNKRALPWRGTDDPYTVWLSEIILQQTRVVQGLPYFRRFLEKFPTVSALAEAPESEVLKLWQGLGYYSRARNLHEASRIIHTEYGGKFPQTYEEIRALPGVGDYTAAAIVSFCYGMPVPVIDGNVIRFICRMYGIREEAGSGACKKRIREILLKQIEGADPAAFNQGLMEFGALVCTPQNPACTAAGGESCPFSGNCHAFRQGLVHLLPVKKEKKVMTAVSLHYLYLEEDGYVWVNRRGYNGLWRGLYDLPQYETQKQAVAEPEPGVEFVSSRKQLLTHRSVSFYFYRVMPGSDAARRIKAEKKYEKVSKKSLSQLAVAKGIEQFFKEI